MIWYGIFLFFIFFLVLVQQNYTQKLKLSFSCVYVFATIFIILSVIRPSSLPDYNAYFDFYTRSNKNNESFEFFSHLIRNISPSWFVFLFLFAFISINLKLYAIKLNSDKHILSILTFLSTSFVLHDFIQIRASCAIGIIWVALYYLNESKYIKYFILILLASLFHISSIIFLPISILKSKKINEKFWILLLILSYVFAIVRFDLIRIALLILGPVGHIGDKLTTYYEFAQIAIAEFGCVNIFSVNQLLKILLVCILFRKIKFLNTNNMLFLKIYILGVCILPLCYNVTAIALRFSELLTSVVVFILPELISLCKRKVFGYAIFLLYVMMFFFINVIYPNYFI